ncbi:MULTISPECIES: hypothetical protein [Bacillus]|uniref:hypothetical protein n=1 Tax=Bacillus TaxID=1386 RepID=UPI0013B36189|nr:MULTISPECIES: hypothetical protein [Bacillus]MED1412578.1 hypothetical protein [Bacillus paramycoides]MED1463758.1 hypothetical protein [Bacillus paramycoides]MED1495355.1 hypothetical protein [Bacillus paramycoides]
MKFRLKFKFSRGTELKVDIDKNQKHPNSIENIYFSLQTLYILIKLVQALIT